MVPGNRLERKKIKTKEKIFQAAVELFLEQGYDETTVEEIAEKADVAKRTFFNYFPTKDAILFYLGQQRVAMLKDMLMKELLPASCAKEKIFGSLKVFGRVNEDNRLITRLIVKEMFAKQFVNMKSEKESQMQFKVILVEIVEEGQRQGEFLSDINPYYVADILMGMYFFTLFQWLEGDSSKSLTEELLVKAQITVSGIEA